MVIRRNIVEGPTDWIFTVLAMAQSRHPLAVQLLRRQRLRRQRLRRQRLHLH